MGKELTFDFVDPILSLGFGSEIRVHLFTLSKVLTKSSKLSTKKLISLLEFFTFRGGYNSAVSLNPKIGKT